jgi:uncharacterized membrane protein
MARHTDTDETQQSDTAPQEEGNGHGTVSDTLIAELRNAVREAAMEVLGPVARQATSTAAKYAVKKGPELVKDNVMPVIEKQGGAGSLIAKGGEMLSGEGGVIGAAGKLASKLGGGKSGGDASGWGRNRRMPVQQWIYVSVPVTDAYNAWTEYKQWPRYMHRANQVDPQIDEQRARVKVTEKMWGFTRPFTAEIVSQRPDELIRWNSSEGSKHTGVINFHELAPRLTLVEVNLDHAPSGIVEKISRGARFTKRAVRADLHRFQAWVEMKSDDELEQMEGWRGQIEDGQIVKSHEDAVEEEERQQDADGRADDEYDEEPQADADEEPEDEESDEPEADAEDEELDEDAEDEDFDEPEAEALEDDEPEDDEFDEPEAEAPEDDEFDEPEADGEPADEDDEEPAPRSSRGRASGRNARRRQPSRRGRVAAAR